MPSDSNDYILGLYLFVNFFYRYWKFQKQICHFAILCVFFLYIEAITNSKSVKNVKVGGQKKEDKTC